MLQLETEAIIITVKQQQSF